jgi:flagellar motor switch protein FliG
LATKQNTSLANEIQEMSTTQRAAVIMLLLGEEQAAEIIKYLGPKEVQALGSAMVKASTMSQNAVNVVLDDFVEMLKNQTSLSFSGTDYVETVMRMALGEDKANSILNRINPGQKSKGLEVLSWMDPRSIAEMIKIEHPQVIAIVLSLLDNSVAADVMVYLPNDVRPEVIQRIASLDTVQPAAMIELEAVIKSQFSKSASNASASFGGIEAAAGIMNFSKTEIEASIMNGLETLDPVLMQKIQDLMFTFENLTTVDNKGIQVLMRAVDPDQLMTALKGASDAAKERFFSNMSERARGMFKDDMEAKGPVRMADVEEAQKQIMRMARKLSDSGELMLGGADFV